MLKFTAIGNQGKRVVNIGLTYNNLRYMLKPGNNIEVDCEDIGLPGVSVFLFAGETVEEMAKPLEGLGIKFEKEHDDHVLPEDDLARLK